MTKFDFKKSFLVGLSVFCGIIGFAAFGYIIPILISPSFNPSNSVFKSTIIVLIGSAILISISITLLKEVFD